MLKKCTVGINPDGHLNSGIRTLPGPGDSSEIWIMNSTGPFNQAGISTKAPHRVEATMLNPGHRNRLPDSLNKSTLDDVGPLGGDKGEKFLSELNEMADLEGDARQKTNPGR